MESVRPLLGAVRVAKGLTQNDLAEATEISQAVISSIESGRLTPEPKLLGRLAPALDATVEFISAPLPEVRILHRLPATAPRRAVAVAVAELAVAHAERRDEVAFARPQTDGDPTELARALRRQWVVNPGPLLTVRATIEAHGVSCLVRDLTGLRTATLGSWPEGAHAIVLLAHDADLAQLRVAVAHELGHALLVDSDEEQASLFARELLLPGPDVNEDLGDLTESSLSAAAQKWGVPADVFARRALDAGAITPHRHRTLLASTRRSVPPSSGAEPQERAGRPPSG